MIGTVAMSGSPFDTPRAFGSGWSDRQSYIGAQPVV